MKNIICVLAFQCFLLTGCDKGDIAVFPMVNEIEIIGIGVIGVGDTVIHPKFGAGVVLLISPSKGATIIQVKFGDEEKALIAEFAQLQLDG